VLSAVIGRVAVPDVLILGELGHEDNGFVILSHSEVVGFAGGQVKPPMPPSNQPLVHAPLKHVISPASGIRHWDFSAAPFR